MGFTSKQLPNPDVIPGDSREGVSWTDSKVYLAVGGPSFGGTRPLLDWYKRAGSSLTRLADPAVPPGPVGQIHALEWTRDGIYLAVAQSEAPRLWWGKRAGDVLTKLADPAILPASRGSDISWTSDGRFLAVGLFQPPSIRVYERAGDVLTHLLDIPGQLGPAAGSVARSCAWSPDGSFLAGRADGAPRFAWYSFDGATLFQLPDPTVLPVANIDIEWDNGGVYLAAAQNVVPGTLVYKRAANTLTSLAGVPTLFGSHVGWTRDTLNLAASDFTVAANTRWLRRDGDVFSDVHTIDHPVAVRGYSWSIDATLLAVVFSSSPFIEWWETHQVPDPFFRHTGPAGSEFLDGVSPDSIVSPFKT